MAVKESVHDEFARDIVISSFKLINWALDIKILQAESLKLRGLDFQLMCAFLNKVDKIKYREILLTSKKPKLFFLSKSIEKLLAKNLILPDSDFKEYGYMAPTPTELDEVKIGSLFTLLERSADAKKKFLDTTPFVSDFYLKPDTFKLIQPEDSSNFQLESLGILQKRKNVRYYLPPEFSIKSLIDRHGEKKTMELVQPALKIISSLLSVSYLAKLGIQVREFKTPTKKEYKAKHLIENNLFLENRLFSGTRNQVDICTMLILNPGLSLYRIAKILELNYEVVHRYAKPFRAKLSSLALY